MIKKLAQTAAVIVGLLVLSATPADAAGGWVANSCAVRQSLHATMVGPHPVTGNGRHVAYIPCGTGLSGVASVTAGPNTPYFVDPTGPRPPFCMQAGQRYRPNSNGAVLTPTVRCR